jgi:Flp pilus assembly pilin Flp
MNRRPRRGQSAAEYMLAISVVAIALAAGFVAFGEGMGAVFENVRVTVKQPYP